MAKRFRFRLEAVLEERKRQEERKLQEWTLARSILSKMIAARDALSARLERALDEATEAAAAPAGSSAHFAAFDSFIRGSRLRIEWKNREIERGGKLTEKKRLEHVAASQKRMAIEKLRGRRLAELRARERKNELKALDDIYVMRAGVAREGTEELE